MSDNRYCRSWEIAVGSAVIVIAVQAPTKDDMHTGDNLARYGRMLARLGKAIERIRRSFQEEA